MADTSSCREPGFGSWARHWDRECPGDRNSAGGKDMAYAMNRLPVRLAATRFAVAMRTVFVTRLIGFLAYMSLTSDGTFGVRFGAARRGLGLATHLQKLEGEGTRYSNTPGRPKFAPECRSFKSYPRDAAEPVKFPLCRGIVHFLRANLVGYSPSTGNPNGRFARFVDFLRKIFRPTRRPLNFEMIGGLFPLGERRK